jgi:hypothetical protein
MGSVVYSEIGGLVGLVDAGVSYQCCRIGIDRIILADVRHGCAHLGWVSMGSSV